MFRIVLPALSNAYVSLFKDTSLASVIAVPELTYGAQWIKTNSFRIIEVWAVVTPMYLVTGYALLFALRQLERRFSDTLYAIRHPEPAHSCGRVFFVTLHVSALVVVFSLAAGIVLGVGIVYGPSLASIGRSGLYSDFFRGIPLLVLIFFMYYGLPAFKV